MQIWDKSPRAILEVLCSSTARQFYVSEIVDLTGLTRMTVYNVLKRLTSYGLVISEKEEIGTDSGRGQRVYYELNPATFHVWHWDNLPDRLRH